MDEQEILDTILDHLRPFQIPAEHKPAQGKTSGLPPINRKRAMQQSTSQFWPKDKDEGLKKAFMRSINMITKAVSYSWRQDVHLPYKEDLVTNIIEVIEDEPARSVSIVNLHQAVVTITCMRSAKELWGALAEDPYANMKIMKPLLKRLQDQDPSTEAIGRRNSKSTMPIAFLYHPEVGHVFIMQDILDVLLEWMTQLYPLIQIFSTRGLGYLLQHPFESQELHILKHILPF
ncbi:uncharacterized protein LOC131183957 isoform X2 [Ahaetulla prasina]|uniref:uncharacterized protein LOC131183957 isoform X2 n=1 Tax=Ahaetulla prasina TaxID=499056 RepID=UPI0026488690|nr:uncharacterized protein LOC131183957 isoform X2 [Ahaetulla prasina]